MYNQGLLTYRITNILDLKDFSTHQLICVC